MHTPSMREAFPIFTAYPPMVNGAKGMHFKDWPSTRPNPAFEAWELALTKSTYAKVDAFVKDYVKRFDKRVSDYSLQRIAGYFRTLFYSFCILAYCQFEEDIKHFDKNEFELRYRKDFFLHGITKMSYAKLFLNGLILAERHVLYRLANTKEFNTELRNVLRDILREAELPHDETSKPTDYDDKFQAVSTSRYILNAFTSIALHRNTQDVRLPIRILDSTLPTVIVGEESVVVPVVEFRACVGNGCTLEQLTQLLTTQADKAAAFAKKGFEKMPKPKQAHSYGFASFF